MRQDKIITTMVLGAGIAFQVLVSLLALKVGPTFGAFVTDAGAELSGAGRVFLGSYAWWLLAPVASVAAGVDLLRRQAPTRTHLALVLGGSLGAAVVLHGLLLYGVFVPIFDMMAQV